MHEIIKNLVQHRSIFSQPTIVVQYSLSAGSTKRIFGSQNIKEMYNLKRKQLAHTNLELILISKTQVLK